MDFEFHKALHVIPEENYHLIVEFEDRKVDYDMNVLFEKFPVFSRIKKDKVLYKSVAVDAGGLGLVWDEEIDLSSNTIWHNGTVLETYPKGKDKEIEQEIEFHEALNVIPNDHYHLIVEFEDKKVDYDMNPLLDSLDKYQVLKEKEVFQSVQVDYIGGALIWPEGIDLSTDEIWNSERTI